MATDDDTVTLIGVVGRRATARALLVRLPSGAERWVPQSVVHADSEVWREGDHGKLVIEAWWALREGLA